MMAVFALTVALMWVVTLSGSSTPGPGDTASLPIEEQAARSQGNAPENDPASGKRKVVLKVIRIVGTLLGALVVLSILALLLEDRFIYHPNLRPSDDWSPEGLDVNDCYIRTADGLRLHGWWLPPKGEGTEEAPVVLFFHGNAGNITHRAENLRLLSGKGLGVLIVDYRGYGKSEGRPSEPGLYQDAEAAHRYLTEELSVSPQRIVCFGRSLGSAVALYLSTHREVAALVLESPLESAAAMARKIVPVVPLWCFLRSEFDNVTAAGQLKIPLLVVHGDADTLVPIKQGKRVFDAARTQKQFYVIEGAGHNDTYIVGGKDYVDTLADFCNRHAGTR